MKNKPITKEDRPLRILMVSHHQCIRVIKQAKALMKLGYTVDSLANRVSFGSPNFDQLAIWQNEKQFKNFLYVSKDKYDIIHYHNEPDYPVKWIREVIGDDKKLVVDCHDLESIRREIIPIAEREMFNYTNGVIYVSLPIREIVNDLHRVSIPNTVLYSYCNEDVVEYDVNSPRQGLVYEGGANPPEEKDLNQNFAYRSLYGIIKRLVELGNETHMFCGNATAYKTYQYIGAKIYPPTDYDKMMKELTKFKYNVVIFNNEHGQNRQVTLTTTNKVREGLMAGLPALACWCKEEEKFIKKHNIGFVFKHIDEVGDCSSFEDKYQEVYDNIQKKRKELVMENFIWKTENIYAKVLGLPNKEIPKPMLKLSKFEYGEEIEDFLK